MPVLKSPQTLKRLGILLLLVGFMALAGIGWLQAPHARSPLQIRFVRQGTNRPSGWASSRGYTNLVFELRNSGLRPLYVRGSGMFSDWPLSTALTRKHLWAMDRHWFSTNSSPVIPSKGILTLNVFADRGDTGFNGGDPGPTFANPVSTFVDTTRVWRFRIKSRDMGPFDLIPNLLRDLLPQEAIREPRYQETILDVEIPPPPRNE